MEHPKKYIKLFRAFDPDRLETVVNSFAKERHIVSLQYQVVKLEEGIGGSKEYSVAAIYVIG